MNWLLRKVLGKPVCDVCGRKVDEDSARCPQCGADFTDRDRPWHESGPGAPNRIATMKSLGDVAERLLAAGADAGEFQLGRARNYCECLEPTEDGGWAVFYFEDGKRWDELTYRSLDDAAAELEHRCLTDYH